jgi:hypothetical protein
MLGKDRRRGWGRTEKDAGEEVKVAGEGQKKMLGK